jgi:hypothetical protein
MPPPNISLTSLARPPIASGYVPISSTQINLVSPRSSEGQDEVKSARRQIPLWILTFNVLSQEYLSPLSHPTPNYSSGTHIWLSFVIFSDSHNVSLL